MERQTHLNNQESRNALERKLNIKQSLNKIGHNGMQRVPFDLLKFRFDLHMNMFIKIVQTLSRPKERLLFAGCALGIPSGLWSRQWRRRGRRHDQGGALISGRPARWWRRVSSVEWAPQAVALAQLCRSATRRFGGYCLRRWCTAMRRSIRLHTKL